MVRFGRGFPIPHRFRRTLVGIAAGTPGLIVTINDVEFEVVAMDIQSAQDAQDTATFVIRTTNPAAVEIDDVVVAIEDGVRIFGGSVKDIDIASYGDSIIELALTIDAVDFNERAVREKASLTIASGTSTRQAVTDILENVPGITISSLWIGNGPNTDGELVFENVFPEEMLQKVAKNVGWLYNILYEETILFWEPGTRLAPWNLTNGDNASGFARVNRSRLGYFNRVRVGYTKSAETAFVYLIMDNLPADGTTFKAAGKDFVFKTTPTDPNHVQIEATISLTLDNVVTVLDPLEEITAFNQTTRGDVFAATAGESGNSIQVESEDGNGGVDFHWGVDGVAVASHLYYGADETIVYVTRNDLTEQGLYGVYTGTDIDAPEIVDVVAQAEARGDAAIAIAIQIPKIVNYPTHLGGLYRGMSQMIQANLLGIAAPLECVIVEINTTMLESGKRSPTEGPILERVVTASSGQISKGVEWLELYKQWTEGVRQ